MSFLYPAFLWALTALAIPVLIHLFQLRRFKRIDFSDVRLLAEVTKRTRSQRKVQHWLVLIARLLALFFLVLAFAQPYLPGADKGQVGQRAVSLYIDDSASMDGQNAQGRLLDQARKGAQETAMAFAATDRFQVLTGRFDGRQQILLSRDEAVEAVAQVESGPYARPLSKVLARQREALGSDDAPVKRSFLFSDLQRSTTDVENWTNDSLVPTVIVPLPSGKADNLSVDSVWFDTPVRRSGQSEVLHVRIRNFGDQALVNVPLRLSLRGRQRALATFAVEAGATVDTTLRFTSDTPGAYWGEVSITDQPVVFDDRMHIAYRITDRLGVMLISGDDAMSDRALGAVFGGDSTHVFVQQSYRALDPSMLAQQDLVVLNGLPEVGSGLVQALDEFVEAGGSVCVFPPANAEPSGHTALLGAFGAAPPARMDTATIKVDRIDLDQPFYQAIFQTMPRNVDLPVVRQRWSLRPAVGSDVLLRLQDGSPYMARTAIGSGSVYLWAAPLAEGSGGLVRHALFATSLLRMAELARPMGALYHMIGTESIIPLEGIELQNEQPPHLLGPDGLDLVPEVRRLQGEVALVLHDQDLPAGSYAVTQDGDTLLMLALDHPRVESDLGAYTADELRDLLSQRGLDTFTVIDEADNDLTMRLSELDQGRKLWKWAILLALLFLLAEVLLIRLAR
jgi:hypothetical protein